MRTVNLNRKQDTICRYAMKQQLDTLDDYPGME